MMPYGGRGQRPAFRIDEIETDHRLRRTFNGERIEQDPETGLFTLVPETDLPDDIAVYARRKMAKALAIFGETVTNQYRPLEPALRVVREARNDDDSFPIELFDACASANRMVANMARTHVIPAPDQDACIGEFIFILRQVGADILANDEKSQRVLTNRNSFLGNANLQDVSAPLQTVAAELAAISQGRIVPALPHDASIATDPNADIEEQKVSGFRLISRIVRYAAHAAKKTGEAVIYADKLSNAALGISGLLQKIVSSGPFQAVWAAILRWLHSA